MMTPNEIRAALIIKEVRVKDIAEKCNVKQPNVSYVIAGKRPTAYIRRAIAEALGKNVSEIWPETKGV